MIEPSKQLQKIFDSSVEITKSYKHRLITLEHLIFAIVADEEKRRTEGSNLKTLERRRMTTRSRQIHQRQIRLRHISTRPPTMLDAPPERGLGGETFIPSSKSRRCLVFLSDALDVYSGSL